MRIAVVHFMHETVTFLDKDTSTDDFIYPGSPLDGDSLLGAGPRSYIGGFTKVAREFQGVELVGVTSPMLPKTQSGSGWITFDTYEYFLRSMLAELASIDKIDGVYLALHGAMAVKGISRPEADIARRIRELLGPRPFIAGTFDPHGNEDEKFFEAADFAFCAKYYPHYDEYLQGTRAARTLVRAVRGDYDPVFASCRVPILTPTVAQWTGNFPWNELVQRALVWEADAIDLYVNIFFGFPWSDVVDAGMTVQAVSNADIELVRRAVNDIASFAWRIRKDLIGAAKIQSIEAGVKMAASLASSGVVVLADYSDRSGAATWLLAEILRQGLSHTVVSTIADCELIHRLDALGAKAGDPFDMDVGSGRGEAGGPPIRVQGRIIAIVRDRPPAGYEGNSPWVIVSFGSDNTLVLTPYLAQIYDPGMFRSFLGLDISGTRIFAIKSRVHFRRGFMDSGLAKYAVLVEPDAPLLGTTHLQSLPYKNINLKDFYPYGREHFEPNVFSGSRRHPELSCAG